MGNASGKEGGKLKGYASKVHEGRPAARVGQQSASASVPRPVSSAPTQAIDVNMPSPGQNGGRPLVPYDRPKGTNLDDEDSDEESEKVSGENCADSDTEITRSLSGGKVGLKDFEVRSMPALVPLLQCEVPCCFCFGP